MLERREGVAHQSVEYLLTPAARELEPIIWDLGRWAARWVFGDPDDEQLDAAHLVWRLHQFTDPDTAPRERTTVELRLSGPGAGTAWLVFHEGASTACKIDPGYEVDLLVKASNRELHRWFGGRVEWADACRSGDIQLAGPPHLAHDFPTWFIANIFGTDDAQPVPG
jgi:hypothetical protein